MEGDLHKLSGLALVAGAVLTWAILPIALKPAAEKVQPHFLVFLRFLGGGAALTPLLIFNRRAFDRGTWTVVRRLWPYVIMMVVFGFVVPQVCFTWAIGKRPAGVVSFLVYAYPCFSVLFATVFLRERVTPAFLCGLVLLLGGLYLVSTGGKKISLDDAESIALLAAPLLVSVCWGASTVLSKHMLNAGVSSIALAYLRIAGGTLTVLPFFVIGGGYQPRHWAALDGAAWAGLAFAAVVCVGIGLPMYMAGLRRIRLVHASVIEAWTPMLTAIFAVFFLKEAMTNLQWFGGALIVAASLLAGVHRLKKGLKGR